MERTKTKRAVTLPTAIYAFVIISALMGAAFSTVALRSAVDRMVQGAMAEAITVRSDGLMKAFTRELSDEWLRMEALSARLSSETPEALRPVMDLMTSEGAKISWVGFAAMDGTVTVASNGMLEGANVSERPWFRRGLEGYFAGDVHEAVLLAKLLDPEGENPPRFIDYALPVIDAGGRHIGVLGLHINFDWAAGLVTDLAKALDIDAVLVSQDGTIIVSTLDADPAKPTIAPFRLAALGATRAARREDIFLGRASGGGLRSGSELRLATDLARGPDGFPHHRCRPSVTPRAVHSRPCRGAVDCDRHLRPGLRSALRGRRQQRGGHCRRRGRIPVRVAADAGVVAAFGGHRAPAGAGPGPTQRGPSLKDRRRVIPSTSAAMRILRTPGASPSA